MKRRRTMLLCVTATSMAAAVACSSSHPVGTIAQPPSPEVDASPIQDANLDASLDAASDGVAAPANDASSSSPSSVKHDAGVRHLVGRVALPTDPTRVGTTAEAPEDYAPTVGTTARVPDTKK